MTDSSAQSLLDQLARGDRSALERFHRLYAGLVNGLALRILHDVGEAEDVTQEVFLQIWRQADRYDPQRGTAEAWLVTITRTRALDRLRRTGTRRENVGQSVPTRSQPPPNEAALSVRKALAELSADQRVAVELAYYGGLTQTEIALALGEPLGTIKTRIRTAMLRLREALGPQP
jgi:RNA polymerase sigma-70 factor (ECF subfamily)